MEQSGPVDALQAFRQAPQAFDAVILDHSMPAMTGDHLGRELRKLRPDLPILYCSGHEPVDTSAAPGVPAEGHLCKPFSREQLAEAVYRLLHGVPVPA